MKQVVLTLFALLCIVGGAEAACAGASPSWTCTGNSTSAEIQTCINSASPGDTITVGAGSGTWDNISITKGINLIGAGIGQTIITAGTCTFGIGLTFIRYDPSDYTLNTPFRLSGFSFDLNAACGGLSIGNQNKTAPFVVQTHVRIDHNRFFNHASTGTTKTIHNYGIAYGVVDHNSFEGGWYTFKNDPAIADTSGWWSEAPQKTFVPGSEKTLYYEDNTVAVGGSGDVGMAECQYGGRYAFRYNTITLSLPSYSLFEMHGHQTLGSMPSCFGMEVYGNRVDAGANHVTLTSTRGGKSFVFNNSVVTNSLSNKSYDSPVTCPAIDPAGQMVHDTYWWGSRINYAGTLSTTNVDHSSSLTCDGLSERPTLGRDIISDNSTPGVSAGVSLPATCAVGQGYWATAQSTTDLTGLVGVAPATPIVGTLYKCRATNYWEVFYTPYTYPHPYLAVPAAPTAASVAWTGSAAHVQWTHSNAGVTYYRTVLDGTTTTNVGEPLLSGTTYGIALPSLTAGVHQLVVQACNWEGCAAAATITIVKLEP